MSLRHEFVVMASSGTAPISELCRRFGISRKTGYKWLARYREAGAVALQDQSRRPLSSPTRTAASLEAMILTARQAHPAWGGRKLHHFLLQCGQVDVPSPSTITDILHRHGLIDEASSERAQAFIRFEHPEPNDLWQMDFKGYFATFQGQRCYPLTVLDDHSRFNLVLQALPNEQYEGVYNSLIQAFRLYGLPWRMTMDNGNPWGNQFGGYTRLTVWLMRLGIGVSHSRPYHPQTQGKDERFHRTLKAELLKGRVFRDMETCQAMFSAWRDCYNLQRPHEALGQTVPASRYRASLRPYPEVLEPFEYGANDLIRRPSRVGQFRFEKRVFKISEAFRGQTIALRPDGDDGVFKLYFCHQCIGEINLQDHQPTVTHVSAHL